MARIITILLFYFFACFNQAKANNDSTLQLSLTKTIKGDFSNFTADNLGNIYLITASNQIKKLNANLDSVGVFNDVKRYGNIFSIDVTNPLKILVYYKDFATILILDKQLNNRNVIDLRQQNILQVKAIAQSYDNNIWLFDEVDNKLKKIDETGKALLETPDFRLLFEDAIVPQHIIDMNGLLYLYNSKKGWMVFDYYGSLKNQFPILNWKDVQVTDNFLRGRDSSNFYASNPKQLQFLQVKSSVELTNAVKVIFQQNLCYILTKTGLEIYKVL